MDLGALKHFEGLVLHRDALRRRVKELEESQGLPERQAFEDMQARMKTQADLVDNMAQVTDVVLDSVTGVEEKLKHAHSEMQKMKSAEARVIFLILGQALVQLEEMFAKLGGRKL